MRNHLHLVKGLASLLGLSLILTMAQPRLGPLDFTATALLDYMPAVPDATKAGLCWSHSLVVPAPNTWRCGSEDRVVYDPCFFMQQAEAIVCDANPALEHDGFVLHLTRPLPAVTVSDSTDPGPFWLVELANGTLCRPTTGATLSFGGARLRYACEDDTYILGELKQDSIWHAEQITVERTPERFVAGNKHLHAVRRIWRVAGSAPPPLPMADLQNAVYHLDEIQVKLTAGRYEQHFEDGADMPVVVTLLTPVTRGDLNQDGAEDAVVLLAKGGGASGALIYAAVVLNLDGKPYNVATQLLGDRVDVHAVEDADGRLAFDFRNIGPGDAACCASQIVRKRFTLESDGADRAATYRLVEQATEVLVPSFLERLRNATYTVPGFREPVVLSSGQFTGTIETDSGAQEVAVHLVRHESFDNLPEVVRTVGALDDEPDAQLALATVLAVDTAAAPRRYYPVLFLEDQQHQLQQLAIAEPEENLHVRELYLDDGRVILHAATVGPGDTSQLPTQQVKLVYGLHGKQLVRETREVLVESIQRRLRETPFRISGDVDGNGSAETAALLLSPADWAAVEDAPAYELVVLDREAERIFSAFLGHIRPTSIQTQEGALVVEMDRLGNGDKPCCPSQRVQTRWGIEDDTLVELESQTLALPYGERLKQGAFPSQWSDAPIQLDNGRFSGLVSVGGIHTRLSVNLVSDNASSSGPLFGAGDLNGDAIDEVAVILAVNRENRDTVYELAVVSFLGQQPQPVASVPLGKNLHVHSIAIEGQQIGLELTQYSSLGATGPEAQETTWLYTYQAGNLLRVEE